MLSPCTHMKRTCSQAFEDLEPPILKPELQLTLHIVLAPIQFQALLDHRAIFPDPYSSRFGLRSDPVIALERVRYFMCWSPPDAVSPPQTAIKKFMLCKIHFSPVGVLTLQQAGLLEPQDGYEASRKGYFIFSFTGRQDGSKGRNGIFKGSLDEKLPIYERHPSKVK